MKFFEYKGNFYNPSRVYLIVFSRIAQQDLVEFIDEENNVIDEFDLTREEADRLRGLLY